jgi:hypothetical protein
MSKGFPGSYKLDEFRVQFSQDVDASLLNQCQYRADQALHRYSKTGNPEDLALSNVYGGAVPLLRYLSTREKKPWTRERIVYLAEYNAERYERDPYFAEKYGSDYCRCLARHFRSIADKLKTITLSCYTGDKPATRRVATAARAWHQSIQPTRYRASAAHSGWMQGEAQESIDAIELSALSGFQYTLPYVSSDLLSTVATCLSPDCGERSL